MKQNHLYLVGCPRSGTTLLQSMVASHAKITSFPETHFFSETLPINPAWRRVKMYGKGSQGIIKNYLNVNDYSTINPFEHTSPYQLATYGQWCHMLSHILDEIMFGCEHKKMMTFDGAWKKRLGTCITFPQFAMPSQTPDFCIYSVVEQM